jgi:DNA-directed RNA polymerase subunit RPC12/RpoP
MRTHNPMPRGFSTNLTSATRATHDWQIFLFYCCLGVFALMGCKKDVAVDAIETDANGYVCLKCGVKLYTDRSVFIGPKCPKCGEDTLTEVVGYYCDKDKHLTIRARRGDRQGAACEQCQAGLANMMRSPREKDLKAWGATKVSS